MNRSMKDELLLGCDKRMEYVAFFRAAPNMHKSDNWDEEEEAIDEARDCIIRNALDEMSDYALLELVVGMELRFTQAGFVPTDNFLQAYRLVKDRL